MTEKQPVIESVKPNHGWESSGEIGFPLSSTKNVVVSNASTNGKSFIRVRTIGPFGGVCLSNLTVPGNFTVNARVKCVGLPGDIGVFMDEAGNGPGFQFGAEHNSRNYLVTAGHGNDGRTSIKHQISTNRLIQRNEWHDVRFEVRNRRALLSVDGFTLGEKELGERYDASVERHPQLYFFDTEVEIERVSVTPINGAKPHPALSPPHLANDLGMSFYRISPGTFMMGDDRGEHDEAPRRKVSITKPFYMAATPVTNAQYERFDPGHRKFRGVMGLSEEDDEAVVNVSWHDARRYCEWLAERMGEPCRLPTEAEWEYACRAGTDTVFNTGDHLPEEFRMCQRQTWKPERVSTKVGLTAPNAWGLRNAHGLVEEWCLDWYGPYDESDVVDPVGPKDGEFRVSRGGSHNTKIRHLRSAKRFAALPADRHWLLGFRVAIGAPTRTPTREATPVPSVDGTIKGKKHVWRRVDTETPFFAGPISFVKIAPDSHGPLYSKHNHVPAITYCPNGDLLAVWFTCELEEGREHAIAMSRLRAEASEWDEAKLFWKPPSRNAPGSALHTDENGVIWHFNGMGLKETWSHAAVIVRKSEDNGMTWSAPELLMGHDHPFSTLIGFTATQSGLMIAGCDAGVDRVDGRDEYGTVLLISSDDGETWETKPERIDDDLLENLLSEPTGPIIAGLHGPIVELSDGALMAFGRKLTVGGNMPKSVSQDGGVAWRYSATPFQPHFGGQRVVLKRLNEGPLFHAGFANEPMEVLDESGTKRMITGLFGALSYDDGETWPVIRLITDDGPDRIVDGGAHTKEFTLGTDSAEPKGYLACVQTPDDVIHLISSKNHYQFNVRWLETPMPSKAEARTERIRFFDN